jgi:putative lipase involved disintegration of autophagic bodies
MLDLLSSWDCTTMTKPSGSFSRTSRDVLDAVQAGIADFNTTDVIVTCHSLGGAIGLLDTIFVATHFDPSINIKSVLFGLPRTGDKTVQDRKL